MKELPVEIGALENLILLDLSECGSLGRIRRLLLQGLSRLELYLGRFTKWAASSEEENASLSELNSIYNRLEGTIIGGCSNILAKRLRVPKIRQVWNSHRWKSQQWLPNHKILANKERRIIRCIQNLFPNVQHLQLEARIGSVENLVPGLDQDGLIELISLALESCQDVKYLVEVSSQPQLHNQQLIKLSCLSALTSLEIANCSNLEYVFPVYQAENLPPLRVFHLINLPQLKHVVGPVQRSTVILPSLQVLKVISCPQLSAIVDSAEIQVFYLILVFFFFWGIFLFS